MHGVVLRAGPDEVTGLKPLHKDEAGFSLVEMSIAMGIFAMVMVAVMSILVTMVGVSTSGEASGSLLATAGLVRTELDTSLRQATVYQVYSGGSWVLPTNAACKPGPCGATGIILALQTSGTGAQECVEWQSSPSALTRLAWSSGPPPATPPETLAELSSGSFTVSWPTGDTGPAVAYDLVVKDPSGHPKVSPVEVKDSLVPPNQETASC